MSDRIRVTRRPRARPGATLIELLVAILLFDMALLSLVGAGAVSARRIGEAGRRNRAVIAATSRIEALTSTSCATTSSGAAQQEPGVIESWQSNSIAGGREVVDSITIRARAPEVIVLRVRHPC